MKVKELLSDKSKWTTQVFARNAVGEGVDIHDSEACQHCLIGAIRFCYPDNGERHDIYVKVRKKVEPSTIIMFNDHQGYEAVKALVTELDI